MSRSIDGPRPGITLFEVLIAGAIGVVAMGLVINAYMGANKSQNMAIAQGMMKSSGQASLHELYAKLHGSHTLFDRGSAANAWLTKVPVRGHFTGTGALTPQYTTTNVVLPSIMKTPAFTSSMSEFGASKVGNTLLFTTTEPEVEMGEESGGTELTTTFGTSEVHLTPFRLQLYVLGERELAANAPRVVPGIGFTYQLMSWSSVPYMDYADMKTWITRLKAKGVSDAYIDAKLAKLTAGGFGGIIDSSATTAANAIRQLVATSDHLDFELETGTFETYQYRSASKIALAPSIGDLFIAFNTTGTNSVDIKGLTVPAYASAGGTPFGFETMVGGPVGKRQVLVRIAYAARTHPGPVLMGQTFQQVVQTFAEVPAQAATAAPTSAPATPTPGPTGT